jgi:hypothetical protein
MNEYCADGSQEIWFYVEGGCIERAMGVGTSCPNEAFCDSRLIERAAAASKETVVVAGINRVESIMNTFQTTGFNRVLVVDSRGGRGTPSRLCFLSQELSTPLKSIRVPNRFRIGQIQVVWSHGNSVCTKKWWMME